MTIDIHASSFTRSQTATYRASRYAVRKERALMLGKAAKMVLFFYAISMLQPVMPLITDRIAHTFYEQQHMMKVHEVKGQFHIHQELSNSLHQSDKEKRGEVSYEVAQYIHVQPYVYTVIRHTICSGMYLTYSRYYPVSYRDIDVPPPKMLRG